MATFKHPYGYRSDGRYVCVNAEPGTFNHECGKPADWIGSRPARLHRGETFRSCFCDFHKHNGAEARGINEWNRIVR